MSQVDVPEMLANADLKAKAAVYADLGLTLAYRPAERVVLAETRSVYVARVGGGT